MKKLLITLLASVSLLGATAQPNTVLVYGNVSVSNDNQEYGNGVTTQNLEWSINPGLGYQFSRHWTVGVQGGYGYNSMPNTAFSINQTVIKTDWTAGVFLRYTKYLGPVFFMYAQLDGSNAEGSTEVEDINGTKATYMGFQGSLYPAIGAFVCRGLAVNMNFGGIGYRNINWTGSAINSEDKFTFNFGRVLNIGISKNFGCGHRRMHGHAEPGADTRHIDTSDDDEDDAPKAKSDKHVEKKVEIKKVKVKRRRDDDDD
ncbi:MAG: hypothetical protein H0X33_02735 [Taibaiella sp.]|nr:hypothetical protein [Taibaiella sp.]